MTERRSGGGAVVGFVLVGVAALAAACSGATTVIPPVDDAGKPDVTTGDPPQPLPRPSDAGKDVGSSSGFIPDAGPPPDAAPTCPPSQITGTVASYDATYGFKLPEVANPPVCIEADIKTMESNFATAQKWTDVVKNIPQACADCLLTPKASTGYSVIVTLDPSGMQGFMNFGACSAEYTLRGGGSQADALACGKALNYTELCLREACDCADGKGQAAEAACIRTAISGACRPFSAGLSACKLSSAQEDYCNSVLNGGRLICAGGGVGIDAGP